MGRKGLKESLKVFAEINEFRQNLTSDHVWLSPTNSEASFLATFDVIGFYRICVIIRFVTLAKTAQLGRHMAVTTRSGHYSPRVTGSISVRGNIFDHLFCSNTILEELPEMIYRGKNIY